MDYQEIIGRRRALVIAPFRSLTDVGFDGPWVTPYQISSQSPDGPALVALHWLEEETIRVQRPVLEKFGYLPDIRFNTVIDMALKRQARGRRSLGSDDVICRHICRVRGASESENDRCANSSSYGPLPNTIGREAEPA